MKALSVEFLFWVNLVVGSIILILTLYLIANRLGQQSKQKKRAEYRSKVVGVWYDYLSSEKDLPGMLIPTNNLEKEQVEDILLSLVHNIESKQMDDKIYMFSNSFLSKYYRKNLYHRKWSRRMNALSSIRELHIVALLVDIKKILKRGPRSKEEFYEILHTLAQLEPSEFLDIFPKVEAEYSEFEYKKILIGLPPRTLAGLIPIIDDLPLNCQYSFIDVIGTMHNVDYILFLETRMNHHHPEIRIRALKAMIEIGHINQIEPYLHFIESENFVERLMVVRLFSKLPLTMIQTYLDELKEDESWLVRQEVAMVSKAEKQFLLPERSHDNG